MFTSVQRGIAIGLLLSSFLWVVVHGAPATVLPVVDRSGGNAYCEAVSAAIDAAECSIELLLSSGRVEDVLLWDAIVAASDRGVSVRVLLDASDWAPEITEGNRQVVSYLIERGIDCRFDDPGVTTHAKLAVIDRAVIVLGSTNWNRYALREHVQADVIVRNELIGELFAEYFDRIWEERLPVDGVEIDFGDLLSDVPTMVPLPDGPGTALSASLLLELLPHARESVHVSMYRMSIYPNYPGSVANKLVDELILAAARGLDVRVVLDDCSFYADSADANLATAIYLYQHGIEIRFDAPEMTTHAKLIVIDGESVVVGSTNWNYYSLERNIEAGVGLLWMPHVAKSFDAFFEAVWAAGRPITP